VTVNPSPFLPADETTRQEDGQTKLHEQKERHGERVGEPMLGLKTRELVSARRDLRGVSAVVDLGLVQAVREEREDRGPDAEGWHGKADWKRLAQQKEADQDSDRQAKQPEPAFEFQHKINHGSTLSRPFVLAKPSDVSEPESAQPSGFPPDIA
jgi:hypothetical protein